MAAEVIYARGKTHCKECGDSAQVTWQDRSQQLQARYCLDCARLLGLVVPVKTAAEELLVGQRTIRRWIEAHKFVAYKYAFADGDAEQWWLGRPYRREALASAGAALERKLKRVKPDER